MHSPSRLLAAFLSFASCVSAADWPQWRGPQRNGISDEKGWTTNLDAVESRILWKAEIGLGFSSFTVAGGRVYTTGHANKSDTVFCFDAANGKVIWKHSYPADLGDKYYEGGTSGTPAVDGPNLYQLSRWGDIICFQAATGKVLWKKNIQKETGAGIPDWGYAGSPLVLGERLVLNVGTNGVALDKKSGAILWQSGKESAGYSTPLPVNRNGEDFVILSSKNSYLEVNVKTGAKIWEFPWSTRYDVNAADPIVSGSHVFISTGYNKGCALIKTGGEVQTIWQNKELKNQLATSVLLDGHLYGFDGNTSESRAPFKCVEFATGIMKWQDVDIGPGALIAADGRLIVLTGKGELIIAKASPEKFHVISRAQVLTGKCWTAPVLSNGRIYARNSTGNVICLDMREKQQSTD